MASAVSPQLLTINEACARLRIGRTKLYELVHAGELRPTVLGPRQQRFSEREIERYIDRKTQK